MASDRDVFRAPKGTRDVLPPDSSRWLEVISQFAARAERFGFGLVMTPIFEHYEVFARVGESTDVVAKEMYDFFDKGDRRLALRPEGTAGTVRAFAEHRPAAPWKVWYCAPNFRYERPQEGRYRQHWQLGAEAIGSDDPHIDIEMIDLLNGFYRALGLRQVNLLINSMGDAESRTRYVKVLLDYWMSNADAMGDDIERAQLNPLRILDSKRADLQSLIESAPKLGSYLSDASAAQFEAVQAGLRSIDIAFVVAPRLVRGFDYYTATVFEFQGAALGGAQNALGGGGRYDKLSEEMGGPAAPAIGFGSGIERLLLACDAEGVLAISDSRVDVFVIDTINVADVSMLLHEIRECDVRADRSYGSKNLKKQWAAASRLGARFGVMYAEREWAVGNVVVKDLVTSQQIDVARAHVVQWLRDHLDVNTEKESPS